ncbi:MAG TPA: DNA polymerase/3'-5' exonuclease PolX, partial [Actinomycetota bacterium]|nr:DNA polymerase/3'-5' exonuclease PolX [Actinomycetota bacterium]
ELPEILEIPNVGRSIGEKIREFLTTGTVAELDALRAKIPAGVREVMGVPGVGPKKAMVLHRELGVDSIDLLVEAIAEDRVAGLPRFGAKTQENIARGIAQLRSSGGRVRIDLAQDVAETFVGALHPLRAVERIAVAGSLRRMKETIGDVDLLVTSADAVPIMEAFVGHPAVSRVLAHGDTKSSVLTELGLQVDLRVVPDEAWGAAMIYFTGSKAHNIRIRERAVRQGLKLSEYGLFDAASGELLAARTEEEVYGRMGLPFIEPTLREDRGEVEAALEGSLPSVVSERQLRGDLHTHTNLTDGLASLEAMLRRSSELGYAYVAVTDHAPNLYMQRMTDDKILAQRERVAKLQSSYPKMRLLHGTELNIDPSGDVDWGPDFLAGFDLTVASVHSHFNQTKDEMTRRVLRAIENPYVDVIGHLTTRQIGRRPPVELDLEAVFAAAGRTGTALEINSHPDRLDLCDDHVLWARRHGVRFAVNTDAHAVPHLEHRRYGIGVAQRGWLTADDVINAWPLSKLTRFLAAKRP